jgi:hypothetical protein
LRLAKKPLLSGRGLAQGYLRLSPDQKYRARIYFNFDLDGVDLYAILYRNRSRKELGRIFLGKERPLAGCLYDYLKGGRWVTDTNFQLGTEIGFIKNLWAADFSPLIQQVRSN